MDEFTKLMKDASQQLKELNIPANTLLEIEISPNDSLSDVILNAKEKHKKTTYGEIEITQNDIQKWAEQKKADMGYKS